MISAKKATSNNRTKKRNTFCQHEQPGYSFPPETAPNQPAALAQYQPKTSQNQGGQYLGKRCQNFPQKGKNSGTQWSKQRPPQSDVDSLCSGLPVPSSPTINGRDQGEVYKEHRSGVFPACQPVIQNQTREIEHKTILVNNSLGNGDKFTRDELESPIRQGKGPLKGSQQTDQRGKNNVEKISELH
ncbi:hypothetical protein AYI70_g980 [Smittium culicis]|uniref:Uncharacterized protein n=1 Tax=Smittium culicis TaxID=133412 RepID=A0A1R1YEJ8_9FUNG|nr:hypothetical protein AYI70_g980 [Smittium culicis]